MAETTAPQAAKSNGNCACLCGNGLNHPRSNFLQGHDQRFVGVLAQEVVDGELTNARVAQLQLPTEVDGWDIQERITVASNAVSKFFSTALAAKFDSAAHRRWAKTGKAQAKDAAAETPPTLQERLDSQADAIQEDLAKDEQLVLGAPVRVKVGRWEYDATVHGMNQSGKVTAVRYYDKNDKEFVKPEGKFTVL